MQMALADARRGEDRARDQYRNPAETLAFFQVRARNDRGGLHASERLVHAGAGAVSWSEQGQYIGLTPDPAAASNERFRDYFAGLPANFTENQPKWNLRGAPTAIYASGEVPEEMAGQVDRVLIFREMHNLHRSGAMHTELTRIRQMPGR